ncbi:MAG: phosphodiesterase [Actinomycetia bacterium]|nr:phosphodiesterase [Actinomycetes bacterium]
MLIAQISDCHVVADPDRVRYDVNPAAGLSGAVTHLNGLSPRPDVVVLTGDLVEHGTAEEYAVLRDRLQALEIPFLLVRGNHEERDPLVDAFPDHPALGSGGRFVQYAVDHHPVRIVVADSTLPARHDGGFDDERAEWLDHTLAERPDHPTVVAWHHPPIDTGIWWMDAGGLNQGRDVMAEVIGRHPQVERVLCGHQHRSIQAAWAETMVSVCPSTAHQVGLDLVPENEPRFIAEPPACQLHFWHAGQLVTHTSLIGWPAQPQALDFGQAWHEMLPDRRQRRPLRKG